MEQISANLLLLAKEWQAGRNQVELISELVDLGFTTVEVRREYFHTIENEMPEIVKLVKEKALTLYYSVPDEVFIDGTVNPKLQQYIDEAKSMGASKVKWNIGDFVNFKGELKSVLDPVVSQGVEVNVENDQTQVSGTLPPIQAFLERVKKSGLNLGYVYDLGNWPFVGGDPMASAKILSEYVRYIHIKDDIVSGGKPVTVPLDEGELPWREILEILPSNIPIALEYPTENHEAIKMGLNKLKDYLRHEY